MPETKTRTVPTAKNPDLVSAKILVDGEVVAKKYHLVNITIEQGINKIPSAQILIMDGAPDEQNFKISTSGDFKPGKKIEIKFGYHDEIETVFKGIIVTNTQRVNQQCAELNIECKDDTIKMTVNRSSRHFNNIKDSDIASQLLQDNQIKNPKIEDSRVKHEQLVQSYVSDWDFMISRIDVNGIICVIKNGEVNIFKPAPEEKEALSLTYGANILEFDADMDSRIQSSSVKTLSWDFEKQEVKTIESDDSKVEENKGSVTIDDLSKVSDKPYEMRTTATMSEEEQKALTNAKKLRQALTKFKGKVKYQGSTIVQPGHFILLNGLGDHFNGKTFVSSLYHEYSEGDWTTAATLGWDDQFFTEQIASHQAASGTGQISAIQGLQTGIVTDITDSSGQYRVKVRLPLVNDKDDGIYARVATLDAGDNRGSFFRPEKNDEVIVAFMNNDPKNPVILGMLHSSAKPSPIEPASDNNQKGFVTRSGVKVLFDDGDAAVKIETPGNRVFEMNDNDGSIVINDDNGNEIKMDSDGISVKAGKDLKLEAVSSISITAPRLSIEANGTMDIKSNGKLDVKSSAITTIQGSLVKIN